MSGRITARRRTRRGLGISSTDIRAELQGRLEERNRKTLQGLKNEFQMSDQQFEKLVAMVGNQVRNLYDGAAMSAGEVLEASLQDVKEIGFMHGVTVGTPTEPDDKQVVDLAQSRASQITSWARNNAINLPDGVSWNQYQLRTTVWLIGRLMFADPPSVFRKIEVLNHEDMTRLIAEKMARRFWRTHSDRDIERPHTFIYADGTRPLGISESGDVWNRAQEAAGTVINGAEALVNRRETIRSDRSAASVEIPAVIGQKEQKLADLQATLEEIN